MADPGRFDPPARRLPAGCRLRRAASGDAGRIAGLLRADDRREMEALDGRPALDVLEDWMRGGCHVLSVRGEATAIFGIVGCPGSSVAPGQRAATPWAAIVSTLGGDDLADMMWLSRFQVDSWQRRWPLLQTVCDTRNSFRRHWLDWLGFEHRGRVEGFGAAGLPFDLLVRLRVGTPALSANAP
ncbi:hypothetical protein [Reyranella sp.]|uniref:hypothetical protein n=1 Tax=Reyranella sp. TaxID=1929291 RepID=UPI003BAC8834